MLGDKENWELSTFMWVNKLFHLELYLILSCNMYTEKNQALHVQSIFPIEYPTQF